MSYSCPEEVAPSPHGPIAPSPIDNGSSLDSLHRSNSHDQAVFRRIMGEEESHMASRFHMHLARNSEHKPVSRYSSPQRRLAGDGQWKDEGFVPYSAQNTPPSATQAPHPGVTTSPKKKICLSPGLCVNNVNSGMSLLSAPVIDFGLFFDQIRSGLDSTGRSEARSSVHSGDSSSQPQGSDQSSTEGFSDELATIANDIMLPLMFSRHAR